ncbi:hypothetical protein AWB77_05652 [Caballeronia fortuita]|uniref:Uncharacterized protein n=1 Tax=Caballeronia fortuita TaxID=1777138 RepID=A0A158DQU1_9BURK|nr:hypothetical protein [Caballeronia fortuita]SAK96780.1 hypothetical protein AWB77_05652 [Caballeronia fortuita]
MTRDSRDERSKQDQPKKDQPKKENEEDLLDEALEETFPASDPIAVHPEPETPKDGKKK